MDFTPKGQVVTLVSENIEERAVDFLRSCELKTFPAGVCSKSEIVYLGVVPIDIRDAHEVVPNLNV